MAQDNGETVWDIGEGDMVTLPDGTEVEVLAVDWDETGGTFFVCVEDGETVYYYCKDVLSEG